MTNTTRRVNACVNFRSDMSWGYIEGTRKAAELVVDHMLTTERDLDTLIYPLGYLYRHHIELQLKWLIKRANWLLDSVESVPKTHRISMLWDQLHIRLRKLFPDMKDDLKEIGALIQPLCEFDDSGEEFRYAKTTKGNRTLESAGRIVDVGDFAEAYNTVAEKLDVLHFGLEIEWDGKCDSFEAQERLASEKPST